MDVLVGGFVEALRLLLDHPEVASRVPLDLSPPSPRD